MRISLSLRALLALGAATATVFLAGCGTGVQAPIKDSSTATAPEGQAVTIHIYSGNQGKVGPDGAHHDTFDPAEITGKVGVPIKVTLMNEDGGIHSFTISELKLNVIVKGAKPGNPTTTTFSFTPTTAGTFRWYCAIPCDDAAAGWAMTSDPEAPAVSAWPVS